MTKHNFHSLLGFLILAAFFAWICSPVLAPIAYGFMWQSKFQHDGAVHLYEASFRKVCVPYKEASWFTRWTSANLRERSWCSEYIDGM